MIIRGDAQQQLDVLAFGSHPDDVEIGIAGTLCRLVKEGRAVGVVDLTRGELSSNGTVEERLDESRAAAAIMGITVRENLELHDGGLDASARTMRPVIESIRRHRPRVVCIPHWEDRHPDHVAASRLLTEAAYRAGLSRWPAGEDPYRPERVVYYFINGSAQPSFVVGTSASFEQKMEALRAHASQFTRTASGAVTPINDPRYLEAIEARDRYFGSLVGERYAEGFIYQSVIALPSLADL